MTYDPNLAIVDDELRRVKTPLAECRQQHGVTADVTFAIYYDQFGYIDNVMVELPPGLPPAFVVAAGLAIKRSVRFPATGVAGSMTFLDLGPHSATSAAAVNAASDAAHHAEREARRVPGWVQALVIVAAILTYIWINFFLE